MKKCWANSYGQCGNKITGEHLISKSILNKRIIVQGFSWCKDQPKEIGQASLVNNFLCNHHNEALSPSDTEIANFVSSLDKFTATENKFRKYGFRVKKVPIKYLINGLLIEKWFIKTLINICLTNEKEANIHFDKILPILYGDKKNENPYGFNFAVKTGQTLKRENQIQIAPLFNQTDSEKELAGGLFLFQGFKVIILIPCSKFPIQNNQLALSDNNKQFEGLQLNWHNKEINQEMTKGRRKIKTQSIIFSWE